jgi:hypothetical protein
LPAFSHEAKPGGKLRQLAARTRGGGIGARGTSWMANASDAVNAYLAHISLDSTTQSSDQFAGVLLIASNITPTGTGVTTSSFSISGSVPTCAF